MLLSPEILLRAYARGLFPMAEGRLDPTLFWVEPEQRGIIPLNAFHLPKRLKRTVIKEPYRVTVDRDFAQVIEHCAEQVPGREETWINGQIIDAYCRLHAIGHAHSIECWQDDQLVGGLYGVSLGAAFFGESMFSRATDASKIALVYLVARLRFGNFMLLDAQFRTDHLAQFGGREISRENYQRRLEEALQYQGDFLALSSISTGATIVQVITQIS